MVFRELEVWEVLLERGRKALLSVLLLRLVDVF